MNASMSYRDDRPQCPACSVALDHTATRWRCQRCHGSLVPAAEVATELMQTSPDDVREIDDWLVPTSGTGWTCPCCATRMSTFTVLGVAVERCAAHGIWFDRDTLARVVAVNEAAYQARTKERPSMMGAIPLVGPLYNAVKLAFVDPWVNKRRLRKHVARTSPKRSR
jgi:Zn-finger nucleic acid-binding protein